MMILGLTTLARVEAGSVRSLDDISTAIKGIRQMPKDALRVLMEEFSVNPAPPLPKCESTPQVPPRSEIQPFNESYMKELTEYLVQTTLGPCEKGAHTPSSTALSGAFILGGKIQPLNFGCVSKEKPETPPTEKSVYRLASVSKTFAVETILQAFWDGKISSLDDEIRKYFPDFYIVNPFGTGQPTFRQMMSQLSGIPREGPCSYCDITTEEMLERISQYNRLMMKPWTHPSYSNLAYSICAKLISERLYDEPWGNYLIKHIASPLNMNCTGTNYTSEILSKMVTNYLLNGKEARFVDLGWLDPSGGVYSTSEDMSLWVLHYLNEWKDATPLGELRRNTMLQAFENPGGYTGIGYPFEIFSSNGYLVRTKSGDLPGLTSFIAMIPELDFGLVLLWNGAGIGTISVARSILDSVIPVLTEQYSTYQSYHFPPVSDSFVKRYTGLYNAPGITVAVNTTTVSILNNTRIAYVDLGELGTVPLQPVNSTGDSYDFRVYVDRSANPCLLWELQADVGEWVHFWTLGDGTKMFSFPGIMFTNFTYVA